MSKHPINFVAIGECMIELSHIDTNTLKMGFAGDTFNVALYLARYSDLLKVNVNYLTAIGDDPYSNMMLANWQQEGIQTRLVQRLPKLLPGLYVVNTDSEGERHFLYWRSQAAARKLFYAPQITTIIDQLIHFDYIYLSGISLAILDNFSRIQVIQLLEQAKQRGAVIGFDTNYRPALWQNAVTAKNIIDHVLQYVTIAMVSFEDEQLLFGDSSPEQCAERLHRHGVKEVIIRMGKQGCLVSYDHKRIHLPTPIVAKIVDATAAGDSFNAAYLGARIKGLDPEQAALAGFKLASVVITHPGAIIPLQAMPAIYESE